MCPRCGNNRSKRKHALCTICFFIDDLMQEHHEGQHRDRFNVSCPSCRSKHNIALRESGATDYVKRVLAARPLTPALARFLLRLDKDGLIAATKLGARGSQALLHLRDQGHVELSDRNVRVSAKSRADALELLASSESPHVRSPSPRATPGRVQSSSHAQCAHESTPKARAKCRAERRRTDR